MKMERRDFLKLSAAATVPIGGMAALAADPSTKPTFSAAGKEFHFDTGVLRGTLRAGGVSKGLAPITEVRSGRALAGPYGLLSPYRLLTTDARFGTAAWDWPSQARRMDDGAVEVRWTNDKDHPLDMTGFYRLTSTNTVDLQLTVRPKRALRRFELFLASYFTGFPQSCAYVRDESATGKRERFVEALQVDGYWQTFPRDKAAVKIVRDGRWKFPPHPVEWVIRQPLAAPLAMRRDPRSGLTAALMAPAKDCFAISMPFGQESHGSVYLALFGRDLKDGESVTARARLVVAPDLTDEKAVSLYRQFEKEVSKNL